MKQTIILILVLAAIGYLVANGGNFGEQKVREGLPGRSANTHGVPIDVLYSDETRAWMEDAHNRFTTEHPEIQVTLRRMPSIESAHAILSGQEKPTIWNPADSTVINYLSHLWQEKYGEPIIELQGRNGPVDLVRSPLVWLTWGDTRNEFLQPDIERPWVDIGCRGIPIPEAPAVEPATDAGVMDAVPDALATTDSATGVEPRGSLATDTKAGSESADTALEPLVFRHATPIESVSGLQAIYLMAYEYLDRPETMRKEDFDDQFETWFRQCQERIPEFMHSERRLGSAMFQFGTRYADVVVTYEQAALEQLAEAVGKPGEVPTLYYPPHTMVAGHPAVILDPERLPEDVLNAARTWIAFLSSRDIQESAVKYSWRPVHPDVTIRPSPGAENPFSEMARFDIRTELNPAVSPASGAVAHHLMRIWRQATGR